MSLLHAMNKNNSLIFMLEKGSKRVKLNDELITIKIIICSYLNRIKLVQQRFAVINQRPV